MEMIDVKTIFYIGGKMFNIKEKCSTGLHPTSSFSSSGAGDGWLSVFWKCPDKFFPKNKNKARLFTSPTLS
jgi:hypothetical protein